MGQLPVLIFEGIIDSILDMVDTAFGNNIDLDSICVLAAFATLYWAVDAICRLGEYTYRIEQKCFTECYVLQMIITAGCTVIFAALSDVLPYLFQLTRRQHELLQACILAKCLYMPISRTRSFLSQYTRLTCQSKCMIGSSIVFWSTAILTDVLVIIFHGKCYHLILMTGMAELATTIFYLVCAKLKFTKPDMRNLHGKIKPAMNELLHRVLEHVALLVFSTFASRMGTASFALYSVGYGIAKSTYTVTDCCSTIQLIQLKGIESTDVGYEECKKIAKKIFVPTTCVTYLLALVMVPLMRGEIPVVAATGATILYTLQCIPIQLYESRRGFLTRYTETRPIRNCGIINLIIIPICCFACIHANLGIIGFAMCGVLNFVITGLYLDYRAKKLVGGFSND